MDPEFSMLLEKADEVYKENFGNKAYFERAIFFSWYCAINDCKFCYMSTQPKDKVGKIARRTDESILAEVLIAKKLGWPIGFLSGGIAAKSQTEFLSFLSKVYSITNEKVWLNIGPIDEESLKLYKPFAEGVCGSIETVSPKVHDFVCPSKPIAPYIKTWQNCEKLGMKKAMTMILGIGETKEDYPLLKRFIEENRIDKVHLYGLIPHKGTYFEKHQKPTQEYKAWWIAKTSIDFPTIDLQAGIWEDQVKDSSLLWRAGCNSVSKFPILKKFNSEAAKMLEQEAKKAGREFHGTMTKMPAIDWEHEISLLQFDDALKSRIRGKLGVYIDGMK